MPPSSPPPPPPFRRVSRAARKIASPVSPVSGRASPYQLLGAATTCSSVLRQRSRILNFSARNSTPSRSVDQVSGLFPIGQWYSVLDVVLSALDDLFCFTVRLGKGD
ncbi:hypothetical protein GWI33_017944 [Rhynchophorus ferrugineus]|uniref:Uncharacterized protein n=1 Tax=Rhynchophorus ferrugineus TaxID=354439 RepID=A0A834HY86_RHYFE|nr:hypothetical protein GWI33_017944 [Rhynchophorus ferrugineus]